MAEPSLAFAEGMGCGVYAGVRPKVTCLNVPRIKVGFRCAVPGFEPGLANSRLEGAKHASENVQFVSHTLFPSYPYASRLQTLPGTVETVVDPGCDAGRHGCHPDFDCESTETSERTQGRSSAHAALR